MKPSCRVCGYGIGGEHPFGVCLDCYQSFWETLTDAEKKRSFEDAQDRRRDDSWHRDKLDAWCAEEEERRTAAAGDSVWEE